MAQVLPAKLIHPLRNKVCIFPTEDDCELSSSDINNIIRRNPYSFNNILYKPYIKRLEGLKKYKAIKRQYLKFKKNNIIKESENPAFYIYNIIDNEQNESIGIVGNMPHNEYDLGKISKIEKSFPSLVTKKRELIKHTGFIAKPVTVIHEDLDPINRIIEKYKSKIPLYEFTRNNGFIHEVWQILDPDDVATIQETFALAKQFYIIDDNNEFEALHQIYLEKKQTTNLVSGKEAFNYFPAFLISRNQVKIHEYKKGFPVDFPKKLEDIIQNLKEDFVIKEIDNYDLPQKGEILLYSLYKRFELKPKKHIPQYLPDSVIFEKYILPKISSDDELISSGNLQFCDGKRSAKCVDNQIKKGNCKFGFIIAPMDFDEMEKSLQNNISIPYKSLYLEPRPLKGLFIYQI